VKIINNNRLINYGIESNRIGSYAAAI